jgi:hypothetical protein
MYQVAITQPSAFSTSNLQLQPSPYATDAVADVDADHDHTGHHPHDLDADHTHQLDDDEPPVAAAAAGVIKATAASTDARAGPSIGAAVWMPSDAPCSLSAPPQPRIAQCSPARHATKEAGRPLNVRAASFRSDACSSSGLQVKKLSAPSRGPNPIPAGILRPTALKPPQLGETASPTVSACVCSRSPTGRFDVRQEHRPGQA